MSDIIRYVQEMGHLAFDEMGFGEVDSLILSELSYLDFSCANDTAVPFEATIGDIVQRGLQPDCPSNGVAPDKCRRLFEAMAESRRFRDVAVGNYVYDFDAAEEKQFAAVTFRLSPRLHYVAFRGTDSTIVGWKEDFNMSFQADVPAQRSAAAYFDALCEKRRSNYILGGHSKGGNLAVYAAMMADERHRHQIALVYDHDGPGFREEVLERPGYAAIRSRIYKTVPESAVVGLLLTPHDRYRVVECRSVSILQHDPFAWKVEGGSFINAKDTDTLSKLTDSTITHLLAATDDATRKAFVDALFGIIGATGAHTFDELADDLAGNVKSVAAALWELDPDVRKMLLQTVRNLLRASGRGMRDTAEEKLTAARTGINQAAEELRMQTRDNFNRAREELQQARIQVNQKTGEWKIQTLDTISRAKEDIRQVRINLNQTAEEIRMQTRDNFNQAQESLNQAWDEISRSTERFRSDFLDRFHQWLGTQK